MKPAQVIQEGNMTTVIVNFIDLCNIIHRQPDHVMTFMLGEIGANGYLDGQRRFIVQGRFVPTNLEEIFHRYIEEYVLCRICRSPDTVISADRHVYFLGCEQVNAEGLFRIEDDLSPYDVDEGMLEPDSTSLDRKTWSMVKRRGHQFVLDNRAFYFNGFNTYWLMIFAADQSTRGKVSEVFQQASSVGLTVCRTWAFNDGQWRALQKSPSVYDEVVFKALDFVVSEARKYKIRLILSLVNNWDAYGGKKQYVKWANAAGSNLTSDDDFFSDRTAKTYYKNHVKTVLNRVNTFTNLTYKDDPTIFAWELMNEPRCPSDPTGVKLQAWIQEMAAYVKSIDPKHLVEVGLEGFYGPSTPKRSSANPNTYASKVGTDFIRNHQIKGIDFASAHIYADSWVSRSISDAHLKFYKSWMRAHITDALRTLKKPIVFGEFGVSTKDQGFNTSFRDTVYSTVYRNLLDSALGGGSAGGTLLWQLFPQGTNYMDDGYAVVLSKSQSTSNIIALQSKRLDLINSRCHWSCRWTCPKKHAEEDMQR